VFVSNIPLCWPLIRRIFALDEFGGSKRSRSNKISESSQGSSSKRIYSKNARQSRVERLHSGTESNVGFNESEERITGAWDSQSEGQWELNPMSKVTGYKTSVAGGKELGESRDNWSGKENIVKTVQVSQYSS
jgi:hypothetical protein